MLPRHLLEKVRRGAQTATLLAALGTGASLQADEKEICPPASAQAVSTPKLTDEQVNTLKKTIPLLGDDDFKTRGKATDTLKGMGKGVVPHLSEALKEQQDAEIKSRLAAIIKVLTEPAPAAANVPEESCKRCGRG